MSDDVALPQYPVLSGPSAKDLQTGLVAWQHPFWVVGTIWNPSRHSLHKYNRHLLGLDQGSHFVFVLVATARPRTLYK